MENEADLLFERESRRVLESEPFEPASVEEEEVNVAQGDRELEGGAPFEPHVPLWFDRG